MRLAGAARGRALAQAHALHYALRSLLQPRGALRPRGLGDAARGRVLAAGQERCCGEAAALPPGSQRASGLMQHEQSPTGGARRGVCVLRRKRVALRGQARRAAAPDEVC